MRSPAKRWLCDLTWCQPTAAGAAIFLPNFVPTSAHSMGSQSTEAAPKRPSRSQLHLTWLTFKTSTAS
jgi:hypothetical protein